MPNDLPTSQPAAPAPSNADPAQTSSPSSGPGKSPPGTGNEASSVGWFDWWHRIPLYLRILGGVVAGVLVGILLRQLDVWVSQWRDVGVSQSDAAVFLQGVRPLEWAIALAVPSKLLLRLLGALAPPLILLAVVQALMHAQIPRGSGVRLVSLLVLNTVVAILIGLAVANVVKPGKWREIPPAEEEELVAREDPVSQFLDNVPRSLLGPFTDNGKVISVILIALAFGIAVRRLPPDRLKMVSDLVDLGFQTMIIVLHWIIEVIPLAVFGIVASIIGTQGFDAFANLGMFVVAVLVALALQLAYYLLRIRFGSWVRPWDVLVGMRDALVMAFSTASSTATMPVTYACLREKVGLRERSASLGALVGANFNNDGTALYEAMAALFVAQLVGIELTIWQQVLVVLTSVAASVGAAGIPEAGIVTMTLVFNAVGLPIEYIPILLTIDWFLDRCRTAINVMGDVNVSCLLDGYERESPHKMTTTDRELQELA